MIYAKCLLQGKVNLHWFHHQIPSDIRLTFHKHNNRITHVTMSLYPDQLQWYKDLLMKQYDVTSLALLVTFRSSK